jgi:hypothetical protein
VATDHFARVPESVLYADVSDRAVRLFAVIDRYAGDDGIAFPSRATLASRLRCSRDAIDRAVKELERAGAIEKVARFDEAGDPTTNLYRVAARVRLPSRGGAATPPQARGDGGRDGAARGGRDGAAQNESHLEREPLTDGAERVSRITRRYLDDVVAVTTIKKSANGFRATVEREWGPKIAEAAAAMPNASDDDVLKTVDPTRYDAPRPGPVMAPPPFEHDETPPDFDLGLDRLRQIKAARAG